MENKKIIVLEKNEKKIIKEKPKKKRVCTMNENWLKAIKELEELDEKTMQNFMEQEEKSLKKTILSQIKAKIQGYASQDKEKKLYCQEKFVTLNDVITLLKESNHICYYCKEETQIMYEYVREPKQWTLERLDNSFGHNNDNVVISCLSCNIRRRTMASEKYVQTKQMAKIVKLDH
tara:strand:- start:168 stop:695 length:528 start_codon:yes stop_codon:yes gene_type:complete